jgi:hypothetical protein
VAVGRALCYAASAAAEAPGEPIQPGPSADGVQAVADPPAAESAAERLAYWRAKGRYGDETVRLLAQLVCDQGAVERLTQDQLGELAFLLECALRGNVTGRSLEAWLSQLAEGDDRRGAAETLRARLVEKTNEVELLGRREAT